MANVTVPGLDAPAAAPSAVPRRRPVKSRTRATPHAAPPPDVAGIRLTHGDRVVFSEAGVTKAQLARYYETVAEWMLPHVAGRPLTLVRCPDGAGGSCFYMKHSKAWAPGSVRRVNIQERKKVGEYLIVDDPPGLIGLVQMNVLEIHTWNSTGGHVERPDRLVLDIDPGPDVSWTRVIEAARLLRALLAELSLESFVKTTGGHGLHVVVPLAPRHDWSDCLEFSREFAEAVVRHDPRHYTTGFARSGREDKILVDYLRNNRTNTSVAAFSTRARPHGPVSMPLRWDDLTPRLRPDRLTVVTVPRRLARVRADPWAGYWQLDQRLSAAARKALATV
jgi:bifunctional non-homologous end joining protein LigD